MEKQGGIPGYKPLIIGRNREEYPGINLSEREKQEEYPGINLSER